MLAHQLRGLYPYGSGSLVSCPQPATELSVTQQMAEMNRKLDHLINTQPTSISGPLDNVAKPAPRRTTTFLTLPGEIRDIIYKYLFTSTRLSFGRRYTSRISTKNILPARNSLAILRVCRQANQEAKDLWISRVLFSFERVEDMLDKLSTTDPVAVVSRIRHVRVGGLPLMLSPPDYDDDVYYRLAWALKLLPDLNLDKLTVFGDSVGEVAYDTLKGLIELGAGWRELHFIAPNSKMFSFPKDDFLARPGEYFYWRRPQPSTWNHILQRRDGNRSSVTMFRSTCPNVAGSVLNPSTRKPFAQEAPAGSGARGIEAFGLKEDKHLLSPDEFGKEILIVVKRGLSVDVREPCREPPYDDQDIRDWSHGMTWQEIQHVSNYISDISDESELFDVQMGGPTEVDTFDDVDEYQWNLIT